MKGPGGPEQAALSQSPQPSRRPVRTARRPHPVRATPVRDSPHRPVAPLLFQLREPRRHFGVLTVLVIALHVAMIAWVVRTRVVASTPAPEPVKVVLKLPIKKVAVKE